jgi:threonine dehydrogenase-like Zn-dependent dehydrogenase
MEAITLLESGIITVEDMITHRLPLSDIEKGFQLVLGGHESIKVIIKPH